MLKSPLTFVLKIILHPPVSYFDKLKNGFLPFFCSVCTLCHGQLCTSALQGAILKHMVSGFSSRGPEGSTNQAYSRCFLIQIFVLIIGFFSYIIISRLLTNQHTVKSQVLACLVQKHLLVFQIDVFLSSYILRKPQNFAKSPLQI